MMPIPLFQQRAIRCLTLLGLMALGVLATGPGQVAQAQTAATCNPAAGNGIGNGNGPDDPADYGAYCWIDFSLYNASQATSSTGQPFYVTLPGGATLTFTLKVGSNTLKAAPVPSYVGAAFGNSAFLNIPGAPILYQITNGATTTITLSNLNLSANGSPDLPFVFVAADGESTNQTESLSFTTAGDPWQLVASPGQSNPTRNMPTLNGTGTATVTEGGTVGGTDGEGSYVFTTDNSPGTVSSTLVGGGLQGAIFGLKFHSIDLALTQTYTGDNFAGGTGSFQITTSNAVSPIQQPPTTPQPIQIVDTLPSNLAYVSSTGSSWTCAASGQVVTCNLNANADLTTSYTLPSLSLNVQIASTGLSGVDTLVNTATIKDVTLGYVFDTDQNNNTGTAQVSIIHPNLSTSTKSVRDLNGGYANASDVLEYTITLKESAGLAASNVSVTDNMPANVHSLAIVGTPPAGSTNNSDPSGGANGAGLLDISGITIPANGSVTIVYDVTIDNPTAPGTTIDNTANIENPNGDNATAVAPTVTVAQDQAPVSGNKILYVYDDQSLTRTPQTGSGSYALVSDDNGSKDWTLTPVLAGDLTFQSGSTVSVNLLVQCDSMSNGGGCSSANKLQFTAALYDKNGATLTQIGNTSSPASFNYTSYNTAIADIGGVGGITVPAGHQLVLRIINSAGKNSSGLRIEQYAGGLRSTISMDVSTVIKVDSVGAYSDANCSTPVSLAYHAGSTVNLCAVISDPFGSYDIAPTGGTAPSITITDASNAQQIIGSMAHVSGADTAATKTFAYTYTVPTSPVTGTWTAAVTAWEGTEHTVDRSGNGSFSVQPPSPDLSTSTKSVLDLNGGDAEPGDVLQYTITLIESAGQAASNVSVTDDMAAQVGSLTVINNAGGDDSGTTTSGGANGTGKLDITGISVPANSSKTIVYNVTIAAAATPGTAIDNTATVNNPDGNGALAAAPTVTVSQSQVPASGNKLLYVYDNLGLTRTPQSAGGSAVSINSLNGTQTWTLTTALAKDLTIKANGTISATLLVQCGYLDNTGNCRNGSDLKFTATLYDDNAGTLTRIGSISPPASFNYNSYTAVTANIPVGSSDYTVLAGHRLALIIANITTDNNHSLLIEQYSGGNRSTVSLDVSTVINVDSVGTYTDSTCATPVSSATVYETHSTVYICAVVSDPFGSGDIDPSPGGTTPTLTITDAGSTQQLNAASMTLIADSGAATKTYEHTYTVPASPPATLALGGWTAEVAAWEGTEHTVSDTGNTSFDVEAPNLIIVKSVSVTSNPAEGTTNPKAIPGATMRYSIIITNQGKGPVDASQLKITDSVPNTHTAFVVGSVAGADTSGNSGLTALTAGDISYSKTGSSTCSDDYTPTADANGTDSNVTNICFAPQGSMAGKTDTTTPAYTITFEVKIQ